MKLLSVMNRLTKGELSQTGFGETLNGRINPDNYSGLIDHINLGLLDLYKRFDIKRRFVVIQQYEEIQIYVLNSIYAQTNDASTELVKYISDSDMDPFIDDVIKIERVFSEYGIEYVLNDDMDPDALHLPSQLSVQVPLPDPTRSMMVEYRAAHPEIPNDLNASAVGIYELELPIAYLEALLCYVASRVFLPLANPQSPINESKDYMMKYELACQKITELSIPNTINNTKTNVRRNGWV